jgi:aryl-alcohol dehydrogenase-like predicted oxidoreductase
VQNHYSVLTREPERDGVLDACAELDVAFVPYFPLEAGLLTGKYRAGVDRPATSTTTATRSSTHHTAPRHPSGPDEPASGEPLPVLRRDHDPLGLHDEVA